jgi:hypothetical protein
VGAYNFPFAIVIAIPNILGTVFARSETACPRTVISQDSNQDCRHRGRLKAKK